MSYILDALKKSDKERQHQSSSLPLRELAPLASKRRKSAIWPVILPTLLFLVIIGGGSFWFFTSYSLVPVQPAKNPVQKQPVKLTTEPVQKQAEQPPPAPIIEYEVFEPAPIYNVETVGELITSTEQLENLAPKYPDLIHMEELPADLLQTLPKLEFAGHAYSQTPQDRLIIINNKIVRENSLITDNLILKEILPEGVVLSYKTIDFQVLIGQ